MSKDTPSGFLHRLSPARIVGIAILGSILVRNLSQPLSDPDLWWHLKTGELIVAERALPAVDPFSYTAAGRPWVVQEWLSEVFLHGLYRAFDLYGILFYRAIALFLLYLIVSRMIIRRSGGGMTSQVLVALTAFAGASNWTERPNLLSFLLFALTLHLLEQRSRAVWWFVPVAVLWANLHGMVILGIGLVALVAVAEWLKIAFAWAGNDRVWAKTLTLVLPVSIIASFLNPYGPGLHVHAFRLIRLVRGLVSEWASPSFHDPGPIIFLALLLLTIAVLTLTREAVDPTDLALVLAFTFMALQAGRNLAISAIVIGIVCARYLPGALALVPERERRDMGASPLLNASGLILAISGLILVLFAGFPRSATPQAHVVGRGSPIIEDEMYPLVAIARLNVSGVRAFVKDFWAPKVIFDAWPKAHVFVDLRWDFYGTTIAQRYVRTIAAREDWERNLDQSCTTHVLVERRDPIAQVLGLSDDWNEVARDELSVTFARSAPATACERYPIPELPDVALPAGG